VTARSAHVQAFSKLFPGLDIQWTVIRCYGGALPPISELRAYDALALSGSHHSAADNDTPWIPQLAAWLADVLAHGPPTLRIVGLCFGSQVCRHVVGLDAEQATDADRSCTVHIFAAPTTGAKCLHQQCEASCQHELYDLALCLQILARALGGTVGKNPSGRFVLTGERCCQLCIVHNSKVNAMDAQGSSTTHL
jgi:hypothetical protein